MEQVIVVEDLVKTYRIGVGRARVREMIPPPIDGALRAVFTKWWLRDTFDALDGVSLAVPRGTTLGMVGHNGAGKTTLLKLIAGVTSPTRGRIGVDGRVAALLDVTVGFHPELTGRENLFLTAGMHGLGRREVAARLDRILDFAELDHFIDTPVKRYSAGMVARLAFGMVAALDADVLLIDEVLAVGDANFQRKCIEWLDSYRERGGTLVFVSHNLSLIRHMTERVVWLDRGKVRADGSTARVLAEYAAKSERRVDEGASGAHGGARRLMRTTGLDRWGAGGVRVSEADIEHTPADRSVVVTIKYDSRVDGAGHFSVGFVDEGGHEVGASVSPKLPLRPASGAVRWEIERLPLRPGIYFPVVSILSPAGQVLDRWKLERAVVFDMNGHPDLGTELGPAEFEGAWTDS